MDNKKNYAISQKTLQLISPVIMVYLLFLALIDQVFYPHPNLTLLFYLIMIADALAILVLTYLSTPRRILGKALLPIILALLVIVPLVASFVSIPMFPQSMPQTLPEQPQNMAAGPEIEALRLIPLIFTGLILVAWQYRMRDIIVFCLMIILTQSLIFAVRIQSQPQNDAAPWLVVMIIQVVSFIIVGYFIQLLMKQLKNQQTALENANANLIDYASTLENLTISRERNAMARELHDTVAHTLSALSVQLETTRAYLDVDLETSKSMLDRSLTTTRSGLQNTRRALQSLRAEPLEDLGLINALNDIAENVTQRGNLFLKLHLPQTDLNLPEAYEQVIYRTAQEALTNILNHANASVVELSLTRQQKAIQLTISDDGVGFDPEQEYSNHFGLVGMRERAELLGGEFNIISIVGQGTRVQLILRNQL